MTLQSNVELHLYPCDSDPVWKQVYHIEQGRQAIKFPLLIGTTSQKKLTWEKEKGITKHQDREWPELETDQAGPTPGHSQFPSPHPLQGATRAAGRVPSKPGRADTAKEGAKVPAYRMEAVSDAAPRKLPPPHLASQQVLSALCQRNYQAQRHS